MTHGDIVKRAERWLRNTLRCGVVLTEYRYVGSEEPDAIGFTPSAAILVECKASRSDFLSDWKKPCRRGLPENALGNWRFYLMPPGVYKSSDELVEGWGVYEVQGKRVVHVAGVKYERYEIPPFKPGAGVHFQIMYSAMRKATLGFLWAKEEVQDAVD